MAFGVHFTVPEVVFLDPIPAVPTTADGRVQCFYHLTGTQAVI